MTDHIKPEEWFEYFSHKIPMSSLPRFYARMHAHIGECEECRLIWKNSLELDSVISACASKMADSGGDAYLAVAGAGADSPKTAEKNAIEFAIDVSDGKVGLLPEPPIYTGNGNAFVFHFQNGCFVEDCDSEMYVKADADKLIVRLPGFILQLTDELEETVVSPEEQDDTVVYSAMEDGIFILKAEMC